MGASPSGVCKVSQAYKWGLGGAGQDHTRVATVCQVNYSSR